MKIWNGQRHCFTPGSMSKLFLYFQSVFINDCYQNLIYRDNVRRHIVRCWNAMFAGKEVPELPMQEAKFNKKISFFEATTESISQFTLSSVIFRIFGISDSPTTKFFQYFSIATSSLSLTMAFITVSNLQIECNWLCQHVSFVHFSVSLTFDQWILQPLRNPSKEILCGSCGILDLL